MSLELIIILMLSLGLGNLLTSFYYRLPRNISLYGKSKPPQCSKCDHLLKPIEYFPIIGWIYCRGKCKKCNEKIDYTYYLIEIITMIGITILSYQHNFDEKFILLSLIFMATLLNFFIFWNYSVINSKLFIFILVTLIIFRTYIDHSIYGWLYSLLFAFIIIMLYCKNRNLNTPINMMIMLTFCLLNINNLLTFLVVVLFLILFMIPILKLYKNNNKITIIINISMLIMLFVYNFT